MLLWRRLGWSRHRGSYWKEGVGIETEQVQFSGFKPKNPVRSAKSRVWLALESDVLSRGCEAMKED